MNDIVKKRLEAHIKREQANTQEAFNQLSLFIYGLEDQSSDLHNLAKILPDDVLYRMISYFDGAVIRLPTKEKFKESLLLALVYYFYEVRKLSWTQIKEILDYDKYFKGQSFISLGKKVIKVKKILNKELIRILDQIELKEVLKEVERRTSDM